MSQKTKFFLYVRKSTDEENRQLTSLDAQMRELRDFARREGILIYETIEESRTAKRPGRPLFDRMLDRIEEGEADGLLCWDIDRLYRNPIDEGRVRWLLQRGVIASIRTPGRQFFPYDAGLLMGVEGGRATDFIIRMTRNIRNGVKEKLIRGEWPAGTKPLGYVYDQRLRNIVPDPKKARIVQAIFAQYATGEYGLHTIAQRLAVLGVTTRSGKTWAKWSMHHLLTNKLYMGVMDWKGEIYEGRYKPLISVDVFNAVQKVLKNKSKARKFRNGHNFPFCGIFHCSCGAMITAQWVRGHGGLYRYYRCTRKSGTACKEPYIQEKSLKEECLEALRPLALSTQEAASVRVAITLESEKEAQSCEKDILTLEKRLEPLQAKLTRLTRGYLDEIIDEETYKESKEALILEKTALKREKERLRKSRSSAWIEPALEVISRLESIGNGKFPDSLPGIAEQVRKIGTNPCISGKKVSFSFGAPYDFIPSLLASTLSRRIPRLRREARKTRNVVKCAHERTRTSTGCPIRS